MENSSGDHVGDGSDSGGGRCGDCCDKVDHVMRTKANKLGNMKRICAWCKADLGLTQGPDNEVTHGICTPCFNALMNQNEDK